MTEKKKHKHEEEIEETQAEAVATSENAEQLSADAELEALKRQLEEAQAKLAETVDGWQRSAAEFQNYKKRIERERENEKLWMKGDIVRKILPVLDDLERALQNRPSDTGPWVGGIELIQKKLQAILESEGIKRIDAVGAEFDPNFHEAISHEPHDQVISGHVIAVVQNGYMLGERVIRPALVRVAQ